MENNVLRDRALKRIKALLEKTEENGASIEEANSALEKATSLMTDYFITINDIEELKDDPIVTEATDLYKIKEDVSRIHPIICDLLDLRHFYSASKITFVGYKTDVKVGIYLYKKITEGLNADIKDFKKSKEYEILKHHYHGNTLRRDFISGWINRISEKVYELLAERDRNLKDNDKGGLVLVKKSNVDQKFSEFSVKLSRPKVTNVFSCHAFKKGQNQANSFNLQNDIDTTETSLHSIGMEVDHGS